MAVTHKIGRRKTSVARVYLSDGKGDIIINGKDYKEYFPTEVLQYKVNQPFQLTETLGQYDLKVNVYGGGITGQAESIRLAISRALVSINEENKAALKPEGLLTRDPKNGRKKEIWSEKST